MICREHCEIAIKVGDEIYCDNFIPCHEVKTCPYGYDDDKEDNQ